MERAVKVLERMENQNTFKELAMDFKVRVMPAVLHWQDVHSDYSVHCPTQVD